MAHMGEGEKINMRILGNGGDEIKYRGNYIAELEKIRLPNSIKQSIKKWIEIVTATENVNAEIEI